MAEMELAGVNLPYSLDAEQSVLGAILLDGNANMPKASAKLHPEHFYVKVHTDIYTVMMQMFAASDNIDVVTVLENCMKNNVFESQEEGRNYLVKLMETVPSISSVDRYIEIVEDKYTRRLLISIAGDILENANEGQTDTAALLELAEKRIYDIRNENQVKGLTRLNAVIVGILNELSELCANPDKQGIQGLKSGFPSLDKYIHGLNKSDLLIVAARPGMGKTSFAMNMATNVAKYHPEKSICVFNLEMSKEQLASRLLSSEALIGGTKLRTGQLTEEEWSRLIPASDILSKTDLYLDDTPGITIPEMKSRLRRLHNLDLVVIDYLQLMSSSRKIDSRVNEISEITRNLKILAKEMNVPVITLSQLSRAAEKRDDHRPQIADLRDSGSIEQDADIVLFLYREGYYDKESGEDSAAPTADMNSGECIVAKNRHGETNIVKLHWQGEFMRFTGTDNRDA